MAILAPKPMTRKMLFKLLAKFLKGNTIEAALDYHAELERNYLMESTAEVYKPTGRKSLLISIEVVPRKVK